jgi:glycosyltransferase involved in cell wall biosynthesis
MRVTVSCHAKSHAFELVRQLARLRALERFVSSDLRVLFAEGIPLGKTVPLPWSSLALIPDVLRLGSRSGWHELRTRVHDRLAARALGEPDVVVGWCGSSRHVLQIARDNGALTVLDNTSTHVRRRDRVLREELARTNRAGGIEARVIDAEVEDYWKADRIMVSSRFARGTFVQEGIPEAKLLLAPHGTDLSGFSPGPKKDDIFRVLYMGPVGALEGVAWLIEAFRALLLPRSELVVCGPVASDFAPVLREHAGGFRWLGALRRTDRASLLRQASVFVCASLQYDTLQHVREALASGVPVIATAESGAEEAFADGHGGFIIPSRDIEALSDRLERLYRDRLLRDELAGQAATSARRWTWDDYGDAVVAGLRRALDARRSPAVS